MQLNVITVDLEEWFVAEALSRRFPFEEWPNLTSTVVTNARRLLRLFDRKDARATWFVLGWVAEQHPELIGEINAAGHEIGCHSYRHTKVTDMTPEDFRRDTERALAAIHAAVGFRPTGYRAPSWSIDSSIGWAFEILADLGFQYDSSIFPIKHDLYGMPDGPRQLFRMALKDGGFLYEMPASTIRILGRNLPVGGGGYLRHSPYWYSSSMIRKLNSLDRPAIVYIHPWETDPSSPRVKGLSAIQKFRTYGSTSTLMAKLGRLLDEFEFATMADYIKYVTRQKIGFERN
ncbi:MAG: DUF3473 domain-containing protein [Candidatus Zixiibacteriota bacterium]|nr:MAG: DUF3473 domain-containing protein [candidate division Zixibacteria bacterium]